MRRVLVAIDGSDATHRVVDFVNDFYRANGGSADLEVIGVNVGLSDADEQDVDLIVVGDNHRGALQRLLTPSTSREVVKRSERPVLIVP